VKVGLYPELGPKRGEAMKWIVWGNVSLGEPVARVMHAHGDKAGADATDQLRHQLLESYVALHSR